MESPVLPFKLFDTHFSDSQPTCQHLHGLTPSLKENNAKMAETENLTLSVQFTPPSVQSLFLTQKCKKYKGNLFSQVQMKLILSSFYSKKGNLQVLKLWGFE